MRIAFAAFVLFMAGCCFPGGGLPSKSKELSMDDVYTSPDGVSVRIVSAEIQKPQVQGIMSKKPFELKEDALGIRVEIKNGSATKIVNNPGWGGRNEQGAYGVGWGGVC